MRLTLVIPSLAAGGAERVLALLANEWAGCGHATTLVTVGSRVDDRQTLHPAVGRVALDMMRGSATAAQAVGNNWGRVTRLRAEIRRSRPDAVVSFLASTNVLTLAATRAMGIPVIVAERIDPSAEPISRFWAGTRRLFYPRADAVVVQTSDAGRWAVRFLPEDKVHVIPNPVAVLRPTTDEAGAAHPPAWLEGESLRVFAAGRLTPQKGFDILLRAFARCLVDHPNWSLVIFGEGDERGRLEALAAELGIDAAVILPGHVPNVANLFPHGDLFVLSSRYEGFPNALLDAMACGLPVISTDCPSGPRQIVRHGIDGLLVEPERVVALHAAMDQLMRLPDLRRRLASRAGDVRDRFSVPFVMRQWNALLDRCTHVQVLR
ncbi:MAG TPA: glycosyltransferase family 4 protein [Vicinamibacterales bacterium]|nr:glycosyltransferase family 4 protein [Vicinamibacterales bacterium]